MSVVVPFVPDPLCTFSSHFNSKTELSMVAKVDLTERLRLCRCRRLERIRLGHLKALAEAGATITVGPAFEDLPSAAPASQKTRNFPNSMMTIE
jgi:hypothetical protein